jgi:hypothetical protein
MQSLTGTVSFGSVESIGSRGFVSKELRANQPKSIQTCDPYPSFTGLGL